MVFTLPSTCNALCKQQTSAKRVVRCQAASQNEQVPTSRRQHLAGIAAGVAGLAALTAAPAEAAFGDAARVFGAKPTNASGFIPYSGEGYALLVPSKWNPSREKEEAGVQNRWADSGDTVNSVTIITRKTNKSSIDQVGSPEDFLKEVGGLLGEQVYTGQTRSEGGFQPNKVSAASLLDVERATDKKGTAYYKYRLLVRTADGNEGGKHQLITAAVGSSGLLYICAVCIGDKRWFKGASKEGQGIHDSFVVA